MMEYCTVIFKAREMNHLMYLRLLENQTPTLRLGTRSNAYRKSKSFFHGIPDVNAS
jgi:hypothetical protein